MHKSLASVVGVGLLVIFGLGLGFGLGAGAGGCTVSDPEYCANDNDCAHIIPDANGVTYRCHPVRNYCMPLSSNTCFDNGDCRDVTRPNCDLASNRCVPCNLSDSSDHSCSHLTATPLCGSDPTGGPGASKCVACLQHLDCPSATPICDSGSCRKCSKHSDCEGTLHCDTQSGTKCTDSLVCVSADDGGSSKTGTCAQNGSGVDGKVVYVWNTAACSDSSTNDGTDVSHPFCTLNAGYAAASKQLRRYVRVLAGDVADPYITMNTTIFDTMSFIGSPVPSKGLNRAATVSALDPTFPVQDTGNVTIDEFDLLAARVGNQLVGCSGRNSTVPIFTLRNSVLRGSTDKSAGNGSPAVKMFNCRARIYNNVIGVQTLSDVSNDAAKAHWSGLSATSDTTGTSYEITNNIIAGNWGWALDFYQVNTSAFSFRFNTVIGNGRYSPTTFGGISCPNSGTIPLGYSIVANNGQSSGSQFTFSGGCQFTKMVVGSTEGLANAELTKLTPALDDSFAPTSVQTNLDCCIDKAQPKTGDTFPSTDIRGTARPQGSAWDIGAVEMKQ